MDILTVGWKMGMWLMLIGYIFVYSSIFLTGLSMLAIVSAIKFLNKIL